MLKALLRRSVPARPCEGFFWLCAFAGDFARESAIPERNEFRMAKVVIERPLKELDRRDELRLEPATAPNVFGSQPLSPSTLSRFGKIPKRTFGNRQTLESGEHRPTRWWRKAVPNSARIHQIATLVISDEDRIKGCRARDVSTDHQFLTSVCALWLLKTPKASLNASDTKSSDQTLFPRFSGKYQD
jgi:hypothetical protein